MKEAVVLDAEPVGVLSNPNATRSVIAGRQWMADLIVAGRRVIVAEIADYEVRRELLRLNSVPSLVLLDTLLQQTEYLPLTTAAMRKAAELWAIARSQGRPTAPDPALDADVILAAQALTLGDPAGVVVATGNVAHLGRYVASEVWTNIVP